MSLWGQVGIHTVDMILICISLVHLQLSSCVEYIWSCKYSVSIVRPPDVQDAGGRSVLPIFLAGQRIRLHLLGQVITENPNRLHFIEAMLHLLKESPLIWVPQTALVLSKDLCVALGWSNSDCNFITWVSYSKENKESQEKPSSSACCFLRGDYLWVSWKGALENAKAACN